MRRRWCRVDCLSNVLLMKTTWRRHVSMRAVWILASMSAYPYSLSVPIAYSQQLDRVIERWEMIVLRFCTQICGTRVKTRWKVLWESTYPRESNRRVFYRYFHIPLSIVTKHKLGLPFSTRGTLNSREWKTREWKSRERGNYGKRTF